MGCGASQPDVATEARGPPPGPKRQVSLKEPNNGHGAANGNNAASPRGVAFPDAPPMITHSYSYEAREIKSRQASFKGKSADYDRERPKSVAFDISKIGTHTRPRTTTTSRSSPRSTETTSSRAASR